MALEATGAALLLFANTSVTTASAGAVVGGTIGAVCGCAIGAVVDDAEPIVGASTPEAGETLFAPLNAAIVGGLTGCLIGAGYGAFRGLLLPLDVLCFASHQTFRLARCALKVPARALVAVTTCVLTSTPTEDGHRLDVRLHPRGDRSGEATSRSLSISSEDLAAAFGDDEASLTRLVGGETIHLKAALPLCTPFVSALELQTLLEAHRLDGMRCATTAEGSVCLVMTDSSSAGPTLLGEPPSEKTWVRGRSCQCCALEFTTFCRRHHCRRCARSVCWRHAQFSAFSVAKGRSIRICDDCYSELCAQEFEAQSTLERLARQERDAIAKQGPDGTGGQDRGASSPSSLDG